MPCPIGNLSFFDEFAIALRSQVIKIHFLIDTVPVLKYLLIGKSIERKVSSTKLSVSNEKYSIPQIIDTFRVLLTFSLFVILVIRGIVT